MMMMMCDDPTVAVCKYEASSSLLAIVINTDQLVTMQCSTGNPLVPGMLAT